jgi:hypothetical protein
MTMSKRSDIDQSAKRSKTLVIAKSAGTTSWPADHVERWPTERLIPFARNARTHSEIQVSQIASSIREWGWTNPVLVAEDGTIIAGHGRVLAARQLRIKDVPVMIASEWTDAQKRAYAIADNKLTLNGRWDEELLGLELEQLEVLGFDLDLIGFSDEERASLAAQTTVGLTGSGRRTGPAHQPRYASGRSLASRLPSAHLRRQHLSRRCGAIAGRRQASLDGDRSALWR